MKAIRDFLRRDNVGWSSTAVNSTIIAAFLVTASVAALVLIMGWRSLGIALS